MQLIKELVALCLELQEVQLTPGVNDEITWNWMIDGVCSLQLQHTRHSSLVHRESRLKHYFGSPGDRQNAKFLHSLFFRTGFGHLKDLHNGNGLIAHLALCVTTPWKQRTASWWLAGSQDTFG